MLQNHAWVKNPLKVQDSPAAITTCPQSSMTWLHIPNCNQLLKNYHLSGLSVVSNNIPKSLKRPLKYSFHSKIQTCLGQIVYMYFNQNIHCSRLNVVVIWEPNHILWSQTVEGFSKMWNNVTLVTNVFFFFGLIKYSYFSWKYIVYFSMC